VLADETELLPVSKADGNAVGVDDDDALGESESRGVVDGVLSSSLLPHHTVVERAPTPPRGAWLNVLLGGSGFGLQEALKE
jgi:hypothetical protein